jgi:hypothetical protein
MSFATMASSRSYLPPAWVEAIENRTLAAIIRDNTSICNEIPHDVFIVPPYGLHRSPTQQE